MTDLFSDAGPAPTERTEPGNPSAGAAPDDADRFAPPVAPVPPPVSPPATAETWPRSEAPQAAESAAQANAPAEGEPAPQAEAAEAATGPAGSRPIAPKEYYSISEVCDLVGLKPHVLRYWESQFPVLNPSKNRSGNRVYQRKEIKLVLLVQHLLYKEKYTIEGARQRLDQLRRGGEVGQATSHALDSEMRKLLRDELQQLLDVLSPRRAAE